MVDLFEKQGITEPRDLFSERGIIPMSIDERNHQALNPTPLSEAPPNVQNEVQQHQDQYEVLARTRFDDDQIQAMKDKGPIGFWESRNFLDWNQILPGGGVFQAVDTATVLSAAKKIEAGEETSITEDIALEEFIDKQVEMNLRGMKVGGGIMYYGSQMPAFMIEFAATAGVGKLAQKGTQEAATEVAEAVTKKAIQSAVTKTAIKSTAIAANVTARTAAMPTLYAPAYAEERLNDFMAVTDKGSVVFKESTDSPAKSALKAFAYTQAEVASEMTGVAMSKYITGPVIGFAGRQLKTPLTSAAMRLPAAIRQPLYQAYKAINPNAQVSKVFTTAGFNGMLEELGEERIADILRATIDIAADEDMTFDDYLEAITPSKDQLLIEAGIIAIAGGTKTSADIAFNLMLDKTGNAKQARDAVNQMSASEQEVFVDENLLLNGRPTEAPPPKTINEAVTPEEVDAVDAKDQITTRQLEENQSAEPPPINNDESTFQNFYRNWFDDLMPIGRLVKQAKERGVNIKSGDDPDLLARQYRKINAMVKINLEKETYYLDENGAVVTTGKGLMPILDDFDNAAAHIEGDRRARHDDFKEYLLARRFLEDLQDREDVKVTDAQILQSNETMSRLGQKYGDDFAWFDEFAGEVYDYQRRVLEGFVREGNMSQQQFDKILQKNPNYIPMQRVMEDQGVIEAITGNGVFTRANSNKVVKKIHGSERAIKDPLESVIKNTAQIVDLAYRNRVARNVADLAEYMPEYVQKVATPQRKVTVEDPETGKEISTFRPTGQAPKGTITVFRDGKKEFYKVSDPLREAMEGMPPEQLHGMSRAVQLLSGAPLLRAGATLIPEFWTRNVIRDQWTALIQSKQRPVPFVDMAKGMASLMGKNEYHTQWMQGGGPFASYMDLSDRGLQDAYKELLKEEGKLARYLKNPLKFMEDVSMSFENGTRLGVFIKAKRAGLTELEAANAANEATLDFTRGGRISKKVNKFIPFFNAGMQGTDKMLRVFKENPKAAAAWASATITVPSIIITGYYLYGAPEEERQEYLEIPQWKRDLFWVAKIDGQWMAIPKPFTLGYVFGSIPEKFMLWGYQGNKPEMQQLWLDTLEGTVGAFSPLYDQASVMPPTLKTMIESTANYNFFTERNIYPSWMDRLPPEKRSNKFTSETGKLIGETFNVSPAKVDHAMRGIIAGSSRYVLDAGDAIINQTREWNGEKLPEPPTTLADQMLIRAFIVRDPIGYRANSTSNFFDNLQKVNQAKNALGQLEGPEKEQWLEENANLISAHKAMNKFNRAIKKQIKMADKVFDDLDLSSEEKVELIREHETEVLSIARTANEWYKENVSNIELEGRLDQ